jgi:capsular polysaccharide biosynthesis protein
MTASILIGVHGAALTNTVFQPPVQSTVIEIGFNPCKV